MDKLKFKDIQGLAQVNRCRARTYDLKVSPFFLNSQEGQKFWPAHLNDTDPTKVFREKTKPRHKVGNPKVGKCRALGSTLGVITMLLLLRALSCSLRSQVLPISSVSVKGLRFTKRKTRPVGLSPALLHLGTVESVKQQWLFPQETHSPVTWHRQLCTISFEKANLSWSSLRLLCLCTASFSL